MRRSPGWPVPPECPQEPPTRGRGVTGRACRGRQSHRGESPGLHGCPRSGPGQGPASPLCSPPGTRPSGAADAQLAGAGAGGHLDRGRTGGLGAARWAGWAWSRPRMRAGRSRRTLPPGRSAGVLDCAACGYASQWVSWVTRVARSAWSLSSHVPRETPDPAPKPAGRSPGSDGALGKTWWESQHKAAGTCAVHQGRHGAGAQFQPSAACVPLPRATWPAGRV